MEKNCKLQLCRIKRGPIPVSGKLRLVDEFNRASTYGVLPWQMNSPWRMAGFAGRVLLLGEMVHRLSAQPLWAGLSIQHPVLGFLLTGIVGAEIATIGTSRFMRLSPQEEKTCREKIKTIDEISITREEYTQVRESLAGKKKCYSMLFNNCLHQTRREFEHYRTVFVTPQPGA